MLRVFEACREKGRDPRQMVAGEVVTLTTPQYCEELRRYMNSHINRLIEDREETMALLRKLIRTAPQLRVTLEEQEREGRHYSLAVLFPYFTNCRYLLITVLAFSQCWLLSSSSPRAVALYIKQPYIDHNAFHSIEYSHHLTSETTI